MRIVKQLGIILTLFVCLLSCNAPPSTPHVKLGINPWPGYELLYLASELGFYQQAGLDVEIIESPSLAEVQRLYTLGRTNAMATTMIEVISAAGNHQKPTTIVLVPDFSNGGDVILAKNEISSLHQLKGKKIGAELGSLGIFLLAKALQSVSLSLDDVEVINTEQLDANHTMRSGLIDAIVTYPPYSIELKKQHQLTTIFSSAEIPQTIVDTVSVDSKVLKQDPMWVTKFHSVWQKTLEYMQQHPQQSYAIMAKREGITEEEFQIALNQLTLLNKNQQSLLSSSAFKGNLLNACITLSKAGSINFECQNLFDYLSLPQGS